MRRSDAAAAVTAHFGEHVFQLLHRGLLLRHVREGERLLFGYTWVHDGLVMLSDLDTTAVKNIICRWLALEIFFRDKVLWLPPNLLCGTRTRFLLVE